MKKTHLFTILTFVGLVLAQSGVSHAAMYNVDPDHSTVMFKVRHLLSKVTGRFDKFEGTFDYDPSNIKAFKTSAKIDPASINTNTPKRDEHLRSPDFFDVKTYPTLTFVSKSVTNIKGNKGTIVGDLTIHGVKKSVALDAEFLGAAKDPWGNERASISASTTIKRADFGLNWNEAIETGGVLVGEDVEIILEIEGIKP